MPNGFHGPRERWDRLEGSLARLDVDLRSYADTHGMDWRASDRGWPSRSLEWGSEVTRLIQLTLVDEVDGTFALWACAVQDRPDGRYWQRAMLNEPEPLERIQAQLLGLLERARERASSWQERDLEFATVVRPWSSTRCVLGQGAAWLVWLVGYGSLAVLAGYLVWRFF